MSDGKWHAYNKTPVSRDAALRHVRETHASELVKAVRVRKGKAGAEVSLGVLRTNKNPRAIEPDEHAASELCLYASNDGTLYRQQVQPIIKNYAKKMKSGKYDSKLALKGLSYSLEAAAKKYCEEFCNGRKWYEMFDVATRQEAAKLWLPEIEEQAKGQVDRPHKY